MTGRGSPVERIAGRVRPGAAVERVDPVDAGNRRRTVVVRFSGADPAVVRILADPEAARTEAHLLAAIEERTSVPVPTPLGSGTVDGEGWLATRLVDGDDLHRSFTGLDPAARARIARSFGRYLAELHDAFRFDAYGPLTAAGGELAVDSGGDPAAAAGGGPGAVATGDGGIDPAAEGAPGEWRSWLAAFGRASLARLPAEFDAVRADAAALFEGQDDGSAPVPRLFPWDFRPGNALLADGRVAAVLDWEAPLAAPPALSVAKAEYLVADWYVGREEAESLRAAFRAGYGSVRERPSVGPGHRVAAVASTAVDSRGAVTNPGYPPVPRPDAVRFHRGTLKRELRDRRGPR